MTWLQSIMEILESPEHLMERIQAEIDAQRARYPREVFGRAMVPE